MKDLYLIFEDMESMNDIIGRYFEKGQKDIYFLSDSILNNSLDGVYSKVHFFRTEYLNNIYCLRFGGVVKTDNHMQWNDDLLKEIGNVLNRDFQDDNTTGVTVLFVEDYL